MLTVLAITPTHDRIGFAYFENDRLIEWGVKNLGNHKSNEFINTALKTISALASHFEPGVAILPPWNGRYRNTVRGRITRGCRIVLSDTVPMIINSEDGHVRFYFQNIIGRKTPNKHTTMQALVSHFPELEIALPPPRRPWESQHYWVPMFDSVARGLAWIDMHHDEQ